MFFAMVDSTINKEINKEIKYWQNDGYIMFSKDFRIVCRI